MGEKGKPGIPGITGMKGYVGDKGDTGMDGADGIGPKGQPGDRGAPGPKGVTGGSGPMGYDGVRGKPGPSGTTGPRGIKGSLGDKGMSGSDGSTGPTGPTGHRGDFVKFSSCAENNGGCEHECKQKHASSYYCECYAGYTLAENKRNCLDMTNCQFMNGYCQHTCLQKGDLPVCTCQKGFKLAHDQKTCEDIDECRISTKCNPSDVCVNLPGSYACVDESSVFFAELSSAGVKPTPLLNVYVLTAIVAWGVALSCGVFILVAVASFNRERKPVKMYRRRLLQQHYYSFNNRNEKPDTNQGSETQVKEAVAGLSTKL